MYSATDDFTFRWAIAAIASADVPSDLEWAGYALESCLRGHLDSRPGSYAWSAAA